MASSRSRAAQRASARDARRSAGKKPKDAATTQVAATAGDDTVIWGNRATVGSAPSGVPAPPKSRGFKVRALQLGYYGEARRRVGDVFLLTDGSHFSKKWMERVDPRTPDRVTTGQQSLRQQHDAEMAARHPAGQATDIDNPTGAGNPLGDD